MDSARRLSLQTGDQSGSESELVPGRFPFRTSLDLTPLLEFWRARCEDPNPWTAMYAKELVRDAERRPELFGPHHPRPVSVPASRGGRRRRSGGRRRYRLTSRPLTRPTCS